MNQPFGSNQSPNLGTNPQIPQQNGWAPQPVTPTTPVNPVPVAATVATPVATNAVPINVAQNTAPAYSATSPNVPTSSFGASTIPNITGPTSAPVMQNTSPVMMESASPKSNIWLYAGLAAIVVVGLFFLGNSMGWFGTALGGKAKIASSPSPSLNPTPTVSVPVIVVNRNDVIRKTDMVNLKTALNKYYNAKQSYPTSISVSKTSDIDTPLKVLVPDYISSLPIDPLSPSYYYGYKSVDGKTFELTAVLEDKSDQAGTFVGNFFLYIVTDYSQETPLSSDTSDMSATDSTLTPESDVTDPAFDESFDSESVFGTPSISTITDTSDADASAIVP